MQAYERPAQASLTTLITQSKMQRLRQQCLARCSNLRNAIPHAQRREDFLGSLERAEAFLLILRPSKGIEDECAVCDA